jgi:hypothetical protein
MPQRMYGALRVQAQRTGGACRRGKHSDCRARVPTLGDVLLPHAQAHPRADLVAGHSEREEFAVGQLAVLSDGHQRGQHHGTDVQHPLPVHVVQL